MSEATIKINMNQTIVSLERDQNNYDDITKRIEIIKQETDSFLQNVLDHNKSIIIKQKKEEIDEEI